MRQKNYDGMRFGRHVVLRRDHKDEKGYWWFLCRCDCGNEFMLRQGHVSDPCGCGCRKGSPIHHSTNTRLYGIWCGIKARCYNPKTDSYPNYGGRGITVCDEWIHNFIAFRDWAMANGYDENAEFGECTIERKDGNGNYEPSNCKWATQKEQSNNIRNNRRITYNGETLTIAEWAERLGVNYHTLYTRLDRGWSLDEVFTLPFDKENCCKLREPEGMYHKRKKVYCTETDKTYISCKDAAKEIGLPLNSVARVARGERTHVHHYHFMFVDEK